MTIDQPQQAATANLASVFDKINTSYAKVYSEGTLQTDYMAKLLSRLAPGSSVLDIGCASGIPNGVLMDQAGLKVTGLDSSEGLIEEVKKNVPSGTFHKTDAKSFATEERFDAIVCSLALLSEPAAWNRSLAFKVSHWLKPDGLLLFGTIDFNDFPVAPGHPVDPTGKTFFHTFMGTTIRDSTFEVGDWIKSLCHAGLKLVECEQRKFDPRPGKIEPEPQCFFLASKTDKNALLGPYRHPYMHYPMSDARPEAAWKAVLDRRIFDVERPSEARKCWRATPGDLDRTCPSDVTKVVLDFFSDAQPQNRITDCVTRWLEQGLSLEYIEIIQASPSNQLVDLVNSIAAFLGEGPQHHGAMISGLLDSLNLSRTDESVTLDLMPARLDFGSVSKTEFVKQAADVFGDFWFSGSQWKDKSLTKHLIQTRLQAHLTEFEALGQTDAGVIGFDCVVVSIDVRKLRSE